MSWTRSSPTTASRPLAPRELVMTFIENSTAQYSAEQHVIFSHINLTDKTEAQVEALIPRFQAAWLALRFKHPGIAVVHDGKNMRYTSPTTPHLRNEWLSSTFIVDEKAQTNEDMRTHLRGRASNSITISPKAKSFLVSQSHWKSDGRAIMQLSGQFLALCNKPMEDITVSESSWGQELDRLVPSLAHLASLDPEPKPSDIPALDAEALSFLKADAPAGQTIYGDLSAEPGDPLTDCITLSAEETAKLIQACRERRLNFGAAIHAAAAMVNLTLADPSFKAKEYRYGVHRDLRSRLPEPWNGPASIANEMVTSTAATIPANSDFATAAQALNEHAKHGFTDEVFRRDEAMWTRICFIVSNTKPEDMKPPLDLIVSSLGLVDSMFPAEGDITAESVVMGGQGYSPMAGGWAYTFGGRLSLTMAYNEAYRSRKSVRDYLENVRAILNKELL